MDDNGELKIDFRPAGKAGKGVLVALVNGDAIYTQKLDITAPAARRAFVEAVCRGRDGIDAADVARTVESLAGQAAEGGEEEKERVSQAQALVALADDVELFHHDDVPFATIEVPNADGSGTHRETHPVKAHTFRQWLSRQFWQTYRKVVRSQVKQDAIEIIASRACFDGPERPVFIRLAHHDGIIYLDLADARWRAVKVTPDGWEVVADPPVRFIRRRGMVTVQS